MDRELSRFARCLLAGCILLVAAVAQAAPGYQLQKDQEALVRPGMSIDEVRQAVGPPSTNRKYRNQPGPTYTYRVIGDNDVVFEVEFDADNRVVTARERLSYAGGGNDHDGRSGRH